MTSSLTPLMAAVLLMAGAVVDAPTPVRADEALSPEYLTKEDRHE